MTTFGEDDQGEAYFATEEGGIFRFQSPGAPVVASVDNRVFVEKTTSSGGR